MIKVVTYSPEHLAKIQVRACHSGEVPSGIRTDAITFMLGDDPIAIFGWYFITSGTVQVWGLLSDKLERKKKSFHKAVRLYVEYAFEAHALSRMQMSVRVGYEAGWRWAKALGFSSEGVMRKYGPEGSDYWLFARVKP